MTHPIDADITLTNTTATTDLYAGPGFVYSNQSDIDDWIAETDPTALAGNNGLLIAKIRSVWSMTGSTYDLSDNTTVGCSTAHSGYWCHYEALNGDTYTFDAMGGLPRITNTISALSTHRRSGNDFTGLNDSGDSVERHDYVDFTLRTQDAMIGECRSTAAVDSHGATSFVSTFTPTPTKIPAVIGSGGTTSGIRASYTNESYNITNDTGTITDRYYNFGSHNTRIPISVSSTGFVWGNSGSPEKLIDVIGTEGDVAVHVCKGDVDTEFEDAELSSYSFDIDARSTAPGSYATASGGYYYTASSYTTMAPTENRANFVTKIESTASVGSRSNPGGQTCSRCYTVEFTETDGDTSDETTIFSGEVIQVVSSRIAPGEDPRTREDWVTSTIWRSKAGIYPSIEIYRAGKTLWIASVTPSSGAGVTTYNMIGGDCLDSITDVCARVEELGLEVTPTGAGTVASPTLRQNTTRLKIDTRSFVATASTCTECLDDPCEEPCPSEIELWDTGEEDGGDPDFDDTHWEVENANGSGVFVPAIVLVTDAAWVASSAPAEWIGIERHDPYGGEPWSGSRIFRTYINSVGGPPGADITGLLACDNEVTSISVNGVIVETSIGTFTSKTAFTLPASEMIEGSNEILFEVSDDGAVAGLLVEWD